MELLLCLGRPSICSEILIESFNCQVCHPCEIGVEFHWASSFKAIRQIRSQINSFTLVFDVAGIASLVNINKGYNGLAYVMPNKEIF